MRRALITGGAKGIGLGTARHLADLGWRVAVLDIDAEALAAIEDEAITPVACDTSDEASVARAFAALPEGFGDRLDLLVNNAGKADPDNGPLETLSLEGWRGWLDSHLTSAFLCTRAAIPALRRARGAIVNIASTRAEQAEPHGEAYGAAKGGLLGLTRACAISLGPEIRCNAILPGWIEVGALRPGGAAAALRPVDHAQHPVGRVGTAGDIAATVAFLASEGAGFITGQHFAVDGGMSRRMIYEA